MNLKDYLQNFDKPKLVTDSSKIAWDSSKFPWVKFVANEVSVIVDSEEIANQFLNILQGLYPKVIWTSGNPVTAYTHFEPGKPLIFSCDGTCLWYSHSISSIYNSNKPTITYPEGALYNSNES